MKFQRIHPGDGHYPPALTRTLGASAPPSLSAIGDAGLLGGHLLALFCSAKCPGDIILKLYEHTQALRDQGVPVIGGFHSPVEQECLRILMRGTQPVIICPARGINRMRLPPDWSKGIEAGRVLVVSPFSGERRRVTEDLARRRNEFVTMLAEEVLIAHAAPGGQMEALSRFVSALKKPVRVLN